MLKSKLALIGALGAAAALGGADMRYGPIGVRETPGVHGKRKNRAKAKAARAARKVNRRRNKGK
jgi:hypothetical protein